MRWITCLAAALIVGPAVRAQEPAADSVSDAETLRAAKIRNDNAALQLTATEVQIRSLARKRNDLDSQIAGLKSRLDRSSPARGRSRRVPTR